MRHGDRVAVLDALARLAESTGLVPVDDEGTSPASGTELRLLVTPPRGAWTSVYVEQTWQAPWLAGALSRALSAPALIARRAGDWACAYQAYDAQGQLADAYHSCPDAEKDVDEDDASSAELERTRGDVQRLGAALGQGGGLEELGQVLREQRIERLRDHDAAGGLLPSAEAVFEALQAAFGLPELGPDFDEVRHFLAEEEGLELVSRAYARQREGAPSLRERLGKRFSWRRAPAQAGTGEEQAPAEDDADDEDAAS